MTTIPEEHYPPESRPEPNPAKTQSNLQNHEDRLLLLETVVRNLYDVIKSQQEMLKNMNERLILLRGGTIIPIPDTGESA